MLTLCISSGASLLPEHPDTTWYNLDNSVCAHVYSVNGTQCLHFPGIAKYFLVNGSTEVKAIPEASAAPSLVEDTFRRIVLPMQLQVSGVEVLHSSAVLMKGQVVALCAKSGTGKSTTAFALSRRGYPVFADDAVPFQQKPQFVEAIPLPFRVRLRADAAYFLDQEHAHRYSKTSHSEPAQFSEKSAPLAVIAVLKRTSETRNKSESPIRRLQAQESFITILEHAWCFSLMNEQRKALMMKQYLNLVARIPIFEITYAADLPKIDFLLDAVENVAYSIL